ncbi:MAG: hypothetical protein M0002_08250 [Rhodospirillales bacterium]|nr:hypothetical protein [Rhodospirillales bacterium]
MLALLAAGTACVLRRRAAARPPAGRLDPKLHAWFEKATNRFGVNCCGVADGRVVTARFDMAVGAWRVLLEGGWQYVPPDKVLDHYPPFPDGSAVVWTDHAGPRPYIYCFVPPAGAG